MFSITLNPNCEGSYFSFPGLRKHLLRWQMDRGPLSLLLLCLQYCHQAGLLSDLYHRALSIWYPTSCCVYGPTEVWVTVSANTTVESRKLAGRPFTWQHICTVIDVIPYPVTLCLLLPPFTTPNNTDPPSRLQTHAALQSAFMLVDFWRLWCRYKAGWRFDMVPLDFHAPCASKLVQEHSAAGTVEIGVLLPLPRRITSQLQVRDGAAMAAFSLSLPWTSAASISHAI